MEYSSDQACCFQFLDLFCNELLTLHCLFPDSLLDGPRVRAEARWCSITFLGTPGMSDGCHANTSTFARRKATSALSYLGSSVALMVKVPPVPSSLAATFLVSGEAVFAFLHLPVELDGASSTVAQHSEEVRLPEWASELLLPDLVFFFPRELQRQVVCVLLQLLLPGRSCRYR